MKYLDNVLLHGFMWFIYQAIMIQSRDLMQNQTHAMCFCSKIKGMSANAWLTLTDHMLSCNVKESEKLHAKERIPLIVNLFYDSLDADKSGKEVSK